MIHVTFEQVKVRSANPAVCHTQLDLARSGQGRHTIAYLDPSIPLIISRLHLLNTSASM